MITKEDIDKRLKERGYYTKSFKVWNSEDYNYIIQECLEIKQMYKDSYSVDILQVESGSRVVSIVLEIKEL